MADPLPPETISQVLGPMIMAKVNEMQLNEGDNADFAQYILLLVTQGKPQAEITKELAVDLLSRDEHDPEIVGLVAWVFEQLRRLQRAAHPASANAVAAPDPANPTDASKTQPQSRAAERGTDAPTHMDTEMSGIYPISTEISAPTGPRSMRNGAGSYQRGNGRDRRNVIGQINRAMDRTHESVLHRVRGNGMDRVGRGGVYSNGRMRGHINGRIASIAHGLANPAMGVNVNLLQPHATPRPNANVRGMRNGQQLWPLTQGSEHLLTNVVNGSESWAQSQTPDARAQAAQQKTMMEMLEEQTKLIQRLRQQQEALMNNQHPGNRNGAYQASRGGRPTHGGRPPRDNREHIIRSGSDGGEDVEMTQPKGDGNPDETICKFNLRCTNKDCKFAHQSPAAPPGTSIDLTDVCSYGAACKNKKCVGRHPSPATKYAHMSEQDCKFYPNCANPVCPFRHPPPVCRNGGDCTLPNCKFTHIDTMCKYHPCTNRFCKFKHEDGQKGLFHDKVWVNKDNGTEHGQSKPSLAERKFVDEDAPEEMVLPDDEVEAEPESVPEHVVNAPDSELLVAEAQVA